MIANDDCGTLLKVAQSKLLGGEKDYIDKFDPRQYLATYYSDNAYSNEDLEFDLLHFQLESLHYIYGKINDDRNAEQTVKINHNITCRVKPPKSRLWDVGSGPSLQLALGAGSCFDDILLTDLSERSLRELSKFLEYDDTAFDWTTIAKVVGDLEGDVEDEVVLERVREKVKEVAKCNVLNSEVVPASYGQFDGVSCLFCLECACDTHRQYENACRNIIKRLKRKGSLIFGGILNSAFYDAGAGQIYRTLPITKQEVTSALESNHVEIREWFEFQTSFDENNPHPRTGHKAVYFICYGVKKK